MTTMADDAASRQARSRGGDGQELTSPVLDTERTSLPIDIVPAVEPDAPAIVRLIRMSKAESMPWLDIVHTLAEDEV